MLQLILGGAGTGKTAYLYERIGEAVRKGERVILLVPEQASFESEKQLYRRLGPRDALGVEVLSFTRLCDRVFRAFGGMAGIHMEDNAKLLLMSVSLDGLRDSLQVYDRNAAAPFIQSMCEIVHEMKSAGVDPTALREAARQQETEESQKKFFDISLIYEAYQAVVEAGYDDPDDHLVRAAKMVEGTEFFQDVHVFVDGFAAFMGAEWGMLRAVLCGGGKLTAALCCKDLNAKNGVFAAASSTARRMAELAARCGVKTAVPVKLEESRRFRRPGLTALAERYPLTRPETAREQDGVFLLECDDLYDEVETVAARIAGLVREGYRYRDIVVIARDTAPYQAALETVFPRYGIPYFDDRRADVAAYPLARGLLCALDAVQSGFDSEYVLALAKSGLMALSGEDTGLLENYCYVWNVTGKAWRTPFENHPDGLKSTMSSDASARLTRANEARVVLMEGLLALEQTLFECDGRSFATAVYHYLQRIHAPERLRLIAEGMTATDAKEFLEEGAQIWDALMGVLDIFGGVLGEARYPTGRFIELFRLCVEGLQIGVLPQTLDQVLVGGADRIRPQEPRAVFVIGLNEGRFPAWHGGGGLFSDGERAHLREAGVDLLHTAEQQALLENYYVYYALTRASERIGLSWAARDTAGRGMSRSSAVHQIEKIFPDMAECSSGLSAFDRVGSEKSAFDLMARGWREGTPEQAALRALFHRRTPGRVAALERVSGLRPYMLETAEGRKLFGGDLRLSPSRLERYYLCPFSFFCESGLGLRARRKAEFNPLESGTLVHLVLQEMVKRHGGRELAALDDGRLREESAALLTQALEERVNVKKMPRRFQYLFTRQVDTLARLLRHLGQEFSQSAFVPAETELQIRENAVCKPISLLASDGSRVVVEGVVDRLDLYEEDGKRYLRVVDYKTGVKKFDLADICHGLNMQMLIYLFSLCDSYGGDTAWRNSPAGVLYMPARSDVLNARRETEAEKLEALRDAQMKMNGLLLDDYTALEAMEPGLKGRFIPAKAASGGGLDRKKSTVVTNHQLQAVRRAVESRLTGMADLLKEGRVEALPVMPPEQGEHTICENCDFAMICLHEADDPFRELAKLDREAALRELGAEEEAPPASARGGLEDVLEEIALMREQDEKGGKKRG